MTPLQWRHNGRDSGSNHQHHDCFLNRLFRRRSKKTSKLRVTGLCAGNSPWTGEFPAQMASNAENASIWWRHHDVSACISCFCSSTGKRIYTTLWLKMYMLNVGFDYNIFCGRLWWHVPIDKFYYTYIAFHLGHKASRLGLGQCNNIVLNPAETIGNEWKLLIITNILSNPSAVLYLEWLFKIKYQHFLSLGYTEYALGC